MVKVEASDGPVDAFVYLYLDESNLDKVEWTLEEFNQQFQLD